MLRFGHTWIFSSLDLNQKNICTRFLHSIYPKRALHVDKQGPSMTSCLLWNIWCQKSHVRRQRSDNATSTTTNLFGEQRKHNHESCFGFLNPAHFSGPLCRSNGSDHMHPLDCPWPTFPSDEDHLRLSIFF